MRPPRARSEPCLTLSPVASQQLVEPAAVHPVVPGQLSDRTPFQKVRLYQIPPQLHRKTLQPRCLLCLDTCVSPGVAYLLNSHTARPTRVVDLRFPESEWDGARIHARKLPGSLAYESYRS